MASREIELGSKFAQAFNATFRVEKGCFEYLQIYREVWRATDSNGDDLDTSEVVQGNSNGIEVT